MAVTRSHKTFDDNDDVEILKESIKENLKVIPLPDESDSDDAPEEESVSVGKAQLIKKQQIQEKLMKQKREAAKQKHKEIEEKRKIAKLEKEIKELEKQRKQLNNIEDEISDELPQELLENFDFAEEKPESKKTNKIVFDDEEENKKLEKSNKRKIREERLKKMRELKKTTEKKVGGGISVKILDSKSVVDNSAKGQNLRKKDEWLMRKRVRRE